MGSIVNSPYILIIGGFMAEISTFKAGMEGVIALQSSICTIDGVKGDLVYRGYNIHELAQHSNFEETVFLLWNDRLPNKTELADLTEALDKNADLPEAILTILKSLTPKMAAMDMLRSFTSLLSHFDEDVADSSPEASQRMAIRIMAKVPTLVAAFHRFRNNKDYVKAKPGTNLAERFLFQLNGETPSPEAIKAMDVALVLHAEHGLNASTFNARVASGTLTDIYSAVTGAIGALKGPLHGGANVNVFNTLEKIGSVDKVRAYVEEALAKKEKLAGFGHRVYKTMDPRATHLKEMSQKLCAAAGQDKWYDMSVEMQKVMKETKNMDPNVDFFSASVYHVLGITTDLFTPIFAISRTSGWTAHIMEQLANNRLIRPRAEYLGKKDLAYTPIDQRA
jgi:citrate synthase